MTSQPTSPVGVATTNAVLVGLVLTIHLSFLLAIAGAALASMAGVTLSKALGFTMFGSALAIAATCGVPGSGPIGIFVLQCSMYEDGLIACDATHDLDKTAEKIEGWLTSE